MSAQGTPPPGPTGGNPPPDDPVEGAGNDLPLGQRLYDSPFLLLVTGILIMFIFFTGWGLWEILSLPPATLP